MQHKHIRYISKCVEPFFACILDAHVATYFCNIIPNPTKNKVKLLLNYKLNIYIKKIKLKLRKTENKLQLANAL